jgi:hypothetical protein
VVNQMIKREFEGARLDLFTQHHRQQPGVRSMGWYRAMSCSPALSVATWTRRMAVRSGLGRVFAQPQREDERTTTLAAKPPSCCCGSVSIDMLITLLERYERVKYFW